MFTKLFKNQLLPVYAAAWLVIAVVHYVVVTTQLGAGNMIAMAEALVFSTVFALLGIGLWFLVKFSDFEKLNRQELTLRHATSSAVTMFIWFGSSYLLMGVISGHDEPYMTALNDTMTVRVLSGLLLYIVMVTVFYLLVNNQNLKERKTREEVLQNLLHESELNSLRAQIKPHFLFNSLNSISSLTITNPEKAQDMVIKLSEFMRYSLSFTNDRMSTLKQELYHLRLYLEIEKVRFGARFIVEENIGEEHLPWLIPPMILQPLVENAVKHGVYDTPGESFVKISATLNQGWLEISVVNNFDSSQPGRRGTGTGLVNVMKRMHMVYGMNNLARITKTENAFEVKLKFPPYDSLKSTHH